MISSLSKEKFNYKKYFYILLSLFSFFSVLIISPSIYIYKSEKNEMLMSMHKEESFIISEKSYSIRRKIQEVIGDLLILANSEEVCTDTKIDFTRDCCLRLQKIFMNVSKSKHRYDQIRVIDKHGDEKIRINWNNGNPKITKERSLQNKKNRYYFEETIILEKNDIYISKLDLNIEHGKIEDPLKPTIRFSTPVYNSKKNKTGILIINYNAKDMLNEFINKRTSKKSDSILLNKNSDWILSADPHKNWSFMYPQKDILPFKDNYPQEWVSIQKKQKGQIHTKNGLFTFEHINPSFEILKFSNIVQTEHIRTTAYKPFCKTENTGSWIAISHIPQICIETFTQKIRNKYIYFIIYSEFAFFVITILLSLFILNRSEHKKMLIKLSFFDTLTNLPNRKLFFDHIDFTIENKLRYGGTFALFYLDLDGFKGINDSLGHKYGDAALIHVAKTLKNSIRKSDMAARIGGDEFVIMLSSISNKDDAILVGNKIIKNLNKHIVIENKELYISVSIGISLYERGQNKEELIFLADSAMYKAKNSGKNKCILFTKEDIKNTKNV